MAKPNSRQTLIDYCLRKLGAPVLEINVDDDQIDDLVDDADVVTIPTPPSPPAFPLLISSSVISYFKYILSTPSKCLSLKYWIASSTKSSIWSSSTLISRTGGVGIGQNLNVVGTLNAGLIDGGTFWWLNQILDKHLLIIV